MAVYIWPLLLEIAFHCAQGRFGVRLHDFPARRFKYQLGFIALALALIICQARVFYLYAEVAQVQFSVMETTVFHQIACIGFPPSAQCSSRYEKDENQRSATHSNRESDRFHREYLMPALSLVRQYRYYVPNSVHLQVP